MSLYYWWATEQIQHWPRRPRPKVIASPQCLLSLRRKIFTLYTRVWAIFKKKGIGNVGEGAQKNHPGFLGPVGMMLSRLEPKPSRPKIVYLLKAITHWRATGPSALLGGGTRGETPKGLKTNGPSKWWSGNLIFLSTTGMLHVHASLGVCKVFVKTL